MIADEGEKVFQYLHNISAERLISHGLLREFDKKVKSITFA